MARRNSSSKKSSSSKRSKVGRPAGSKNKRRRSKSRSKKIRCDPFNPVKEPICPPGELSYGGSCIPKCPTGDLFSIKHEEKGATTFEDVGLLQSPVMAATGNRAYVQLSPASHGFCPELILNKIVKGMKYIGKKYDLDLCEAKEGDGEDGGGESPPVNDRDRFNANFEIDWKTGKIYEAKQGYKRDACSGHLKFVPELYVDEVLNGNFPSEMRVPLGNVKKAAYYKYIDTKMNMMSDKVGVSRALSGDASSDTKLAELSARVYNIKEILSNGDPQIMGNPFIISFDKFTVNKFTRKIEPKCPKGKFRNRYGQCVDVNDIYEDCTPMEKQLMTINDTRMEKLKTLLDDKSAESKDCGATTLLRSALNDQAMATAVKT